MRKILVASTLSLALLTTPILTTTGYALTKEEQKLNELKQQEKDKRNQLDQLYPEYNNAKNELLNIEKQVVEKQEKINQLNMRIVQEEEELKKLQGVLNEKLVVLYTKGSTGYIKELLRSKTLKDFFTNLDMINVMVQHDNYFIKQVKSTKKQLEKDRLDKEKEIKSLQPLLTQAQQQYQKMEVEYNKIQSDIKKIEKEEQITEEAIKKAKEDLSAAANKRGDYKASGLFLWPTQGGKITSPYGPRSGRMHEGIDIGNDLGRPIYASDGGVVTRIKSDPNGYGMYIVISHGNGFSSLYAHMYSSTIKVNVGDKVYKGQVIAKIGNNGRSTGPHLHFEIMKNGANVDPLKYVRK